MMDMAIGGSLTSELNYNIRTGSQGSKCNVSIGRNKFLGLEELIKAEQSIGEEKEHTYLIFEGNPDLETVPNLGEIQGIFLLLESHNSIKICLMFLG